MFESIGRSFALVKTSWNILMDDKKLLVFPALSGIVTLIVLATFILPLILAEFVQSAIPGGTVFFYGILFAFYFASYFVVIFFNTALISCVNARLQGKDMSVGEGLSNAARHLPSILAWALVSATVGIILHLIERRAGFIGRIATALTGGIWSLVTFFVVPILILEDKGVVDSVKESVSLMKRTWGESIVGSGSIMLIFIATGIVGLLFVFATLLVGNMIVFGFAVVMFIILVVVLAIVASAMQGIYVTALYTYARTGTVPAAFNKDLIQNAFIPTQAGPGTI
jgi:ABC-type multidrug transport system fused ATPase/permease subunit